MAQAAASRTTPFASFAAIAERVAPALRRCCPARCAAFRSIPAARSRHSDVALEPHAERRLVQPSSSTGSSARQLRVVRERSRRPPGLAVPRADVLADVAAEEPVAEPAGEVSADRRLELDRPVADAPAWRRATAGRRRRRSGRRRGSAVQVPQWLGGERLVGPSSRSMSSAPRKKKLPRLRSMSIVFLPTQPSPARRAKSRSSSGAVSATPRPSAAGAGLGFEPRGEGVQPVPDEAVVVGTVGVRCDAGERSVGRGREPLPVAVARLPVLHPEHHDGADAAEDRGRRAAGRRGACGGSPSRRRSRGRASPRSARTRRPRSPGRRRQREPEFGETLTASGERVRCGLLLFTPPLGQAVSSASLKPHLRAEVLLARR